jgi:hypothetical protein
MLRNRSHLIVDIDLLETNMLGLLEGFADEQVFWPQFSGLADGLRQGSLEPAQVDEICARIDLLFDMACTLHDCA